ncbi:MAG: sugar ABC transporter permease [Actinobacteria bacterium]|nr:sugar ABC transporter permease [Actinomycetota bacterium]
MLKSNIKNNKFKTQSIYFLFIIPALIIFIIFRAWPTIYSFILSFFNVNIISGNTFIGLKNYIDLIHDQTYVRSLLVTIRFTLIILLLTIIWSLFVSIFLDYKFLRYSNFFKSLFFMPFVTSWVVISLIWKWFLNSKYGLVNQILNIFHLPGQEWLSNPKLTLWTVIFITIWKLGGYFILIFLANLQIIDPSLYEAAEVDGANFWSKFRYITLNALKPAFYITIITGTVFYFRTFVIIFAMTSGDPLGSTDLLAYHTYQLAFKSFEFGQSSASIVFMFVIIVIILLLQIAFFERRD